MTAVDRPDNGQDEGHCSGHLCWYTLPVVDGLVVAHSAAGTLDICEGGGRPPLPPLPAVADSQEQCDIAEVLHADGTLVWGVALVKAQQILDRLTSGRAGAGEQQRELAARWLRRLSCEGPPPVAGREFVALSLDWADELLTLLDRTQPDDDPGPQCPSTSHDTDGGWRCEHRAGHDPKVKHRNGAVEW